MNTKEKTNEYAAIGFYGKEVKERFNTLVNEYKNLYAMTNDNAVRPTTADIIDGLCDVLQADIRTMQNELAKGFMKGEEMFSSMKSEKGL